MHRNRSHGPARADARRGEAVTDLVSPFRSLFNIEVTSMSNRYMLPPLACAALVAALALGVGNAACAADEHHHTAGETNKLSLDHGKKWATDQPLREGMTAIRTALAEKHGGIHRGTLTSREYQALGATIEARVATIIAQCKLEPAADANLHVIVAELLAAADAMQGKSPTPPAAGALQAVQAANRYGKYFEHPGWKPLK